MIKFTVIINNYNYGRFIAEAVLSVTKQTHPVHEIIVVDDGSTDDSLARLDDLCKTHPEIKVLSQVNSGQLAAIRSGVNEASGEWFCFLDADDTWEATHLEAAAEAISREPDLGVYYSGHRETSGPPVFRSEWPYGSVGPCAGLIAARGTWIGTITSALCIKKEFTKGVARLDESFEQDWKTRADDCLVFGAAIAGAIFHYNPIESVNYRIHGGNAFADKVQNPYLVYRYDLLKWRLIIDYCEKCGIRRDELFRLMLWEFSVFERNRKHPKCRSIFLKALRRTPAPIFLKIKFIWRVIRGKYR